MDRTIVHLDLDSFFVSVERLLNSDLIGKPVIIGGTSDRGVVSSCSYEARKFGVHSAMPMRMAKRLCPNAIYIRGDYDQYSKYSSMVTAVIDSKAPLFEKASIDEHYIDITGMDKFFGCLNWTKELRQTIIKETGLPISFGLSVNKTVSKIATDESKPNGELEVTQERVRPFLNPLSVTKIPMVGEKTGMMLKSMGVHTIETLSKIPLETMIRVMGANGKIFWQKANGIDNSIVEPYRERKSISAEETFEKDTIDIKLLETKLLGMTDDLAFQLRKEKKLASVLTVKIRYSNFDTHTQQVKIPYTSADHILQPKVKEIFQKLYNRRMLIRLIGLKLSNFASGHYQSHLFDDSEEMLNLYQAMDRMKIRYGDDAVVKAFRLR
jgi:DNA polymerase-4